MRVLTPSACCATLCAITSRVAISRHFARMCERAGNGVIIRETARKRYFSRFTRFHACPFTRVRVLACTRTSTRVCVCEYTHVRVRVLACDSCATREGCQVACEWHCMPSLYRTRVVDRIVNSE